MECKDYITLFSLIATILISNWLVSKQIRKNKKSGWIEDLRKEVATFTAYGVTLTPENSKIRLPKIIQSSSVIILLLDDKDNDQKELIGIVAETTVFLSQPFTKNHVEDFQKKHKRIIDLAKQIIFQEISKL